MNTFKYTSRKKIQHYATETGSSPTTFIGYLVL